MGDRTMVEVVIDPKHKDTVLKAFDVKEAFTEMKYAGLESRLQLTFEEVNYGGLDILAELAKSIDFVGISYAGCSYGACVFHSVETDVVRTVETGNEGEGFVVYYDMDTKQPPKSDVENIANYIDAFNSFMKGVK